MSDITIPFNITLLDTNESTLKGLIPVKTQDIFDGQTKNFHNEGLYSTIIFGRVGDERRKRMFSYIDVRLPIIHPLVYRSLCALKRMYGEIMSSKVYAVWDESIKDFVKSNVLEGHTGYDFFMMHWQKIEYESKPSDMREELISLINKFKSTPTKSTPTKVIVSPAAYRDFEITGDGRYAEEEANLLYKKLISLASTIPPNIDPEDMHYHNNTRLVLQRTFNEIYNLYEAMIKGKKKLMLGKWASRKVFNGTRNVITGITYKSDKLHSPGNVSINDTIVGLYQFLKATLPISKYNLRSGFLSQVFVGPNSPAKLVNMKTLKSEMVDIKPAIFDGWMSEEGIERVISQYGEVTLRHKELIINGYYLGLVYKAPGVFKIFQDIDELPDGLSRDDVYPLTFAELVYASVYKTASKYPMFVTRYPIASPFSIYPSTTYLKTTVEGEERVELNDSWGFDDTTTAYQFPIRGLSFVESLGPSPIALKGLGADKSY